MQYSDGRISQSSDIHAFSNIEKLIEDHFPNLLSINDNHSITFVHLSFKEYLYHHLEQSDSEWLSKARRKVARCCLVYLNLRDLAIYAKNCQTIIGKKFLSCNLYNRQIKI